MKTPSDIRYTVRDLHDPAWHDQGSFSFGDELTLHLHGVLGPCGLSPLGADLLEIGAAVFRLEQQLKSAHLRRVPKQWELHLRVREPGVWTASARARLVELLQHMGNSRWAIDFAQRGRTVAYTPNEQARRFSQVALFSGGLDSACGAAQLGAEAEDTLLFGYYSRQRRLQETLAQQLGPFALTQLQASWTGIAGGRRSFYYRALFFLLAGSAVAEAVGARQLLQFENGILATAVPPAPSLRMTHHATPFLQSGLAALLGELSGDRWRVDNPFLKLTKRQAFEQAVGRRPELDLPRLLRQTESCWAFNAITSLGRKEKKRRKPRGMGCGRCVPCLLRHTVFPDERVAVDLSKDRNRNDPVFGSYLRSYAGFLQAVNHVKSPAEFLYRLVPAESRALLRASPAIAPAELLGLFQRFSRELFESYGIRET